MCSSILSLLLLQLLIAQDCSAAAKRKEAVEKIKRKQTMSGRFSYLCLEDQVPPCPAHGQLNVHQLHLISAEGVKRRCAGRVHQFKEMHGSFSWFGAVRLAHLFLSHSAAVHCNWCRVSCSGGKLVDQDSYRLCQRTVNLYVPDLLKQNSQNFCSVLWVSMFHKDASS